MVGPVYARLRSLLEEDPSRSSYSLIITGHSAGGAIATLLYAHMLAEGVGSELGILAGCIITVSHFTKSDGILTKRQVSNGSIASHSAPRLSPFFPFTNLQLLDTKNPSSSLSLMKVTQCPARIKHTSAPYSTSTLPLVPVPGQNL